MGMKYNWWYSGLATVVFRISGNFHVIQGINKVFWPSETNAEFHFFSPTPENLDNPENLVFSGLSGFSSAGRKKWIADLESTPQKTFIKKRKRRVFLYVHKVK